ncbi:MAG: SHOCT domain-containing protein [archaeon]
MAIDDATKLLIGLLALVVLFPLFVMAVVMPFGATMMGTSFGYHTGGWFGIFALAPIVLLLLIGWVAYRYLGDSAGADRAIEELRAAYARGDLTTAEFEERLERLEGPDDRE